MQVYIDNQETRSIDGYRIGGGLYIPPGNDGAGEVKVDASGESIRVYLRPGPEGTPSVGIVKPEYTKKIQDAIRLLKDKAPEHYKKLAHNAELILPGLVNASSGRANVITIAKDDLDNGTITWIAGTLAHEAEHLRIYHTDRALYANDKENERLAYEANLDALKLVGADQREIDWTLKALKDPPVQDGR